MRHEFARRAIRGKPSESWPKNNKDAEGGATADGMDHARGIGVVIAEQLHHPTIEMPAPGRVDNPGHRANHDSDDPEGARPHALDQRARHDRSHRPREQKERRPEYAGKTVAEICSHFLRRGPKLRGPGSTVEDQTFAFEDPRTI